MTTTLNVLTELEGDHYLVTAAVQPGGTLPVEIFVYTNTGTNILGEFFGTCSVEELGRLPIFSGTTIPIFGNRFVRYNQAKIIVTTQDDPSTVITALVKNVTALSKALQTKINTSSNYIIP